jgi:hypothetical protein
MACPRCGDDKHLEVIATTSVVPTPGGTDIRRATTRDDIWDDDSDCKCLSCGWIGAVEGARRPTPDKIK